MKLCIVKPDGSMTEILFSDKQPPIDVINEDILIFENYIYKLIIRGEYLTEGAELFVGDYAIPLTYNMNTGCYETERELIFGGCFDLTYVSLNIDDGNGEETTYYTDFLRVATTKQTARQVEKMLDEIEQNIPNFLEICFSKSRKKSGLIKRDIRSIWNTLKIVDETISIYEENYGYFSNHKKSYVEQVAAIVDVREMKKVNQESLIWIASNPENLICCDKESVIKINEKNYVPSKIKTHISQYSYDVYENRVVLGFLKRIILYLEKQVEGFEREMLELENIPESILLQLPNTHTLTGRCIFVYYKGIIKKIEDRLKVLYDLYYRYEKICACVPEVIYTVPKLTNTFKQVYHYRMCFECMVKWFQAGDYSFNHLNYLFKLKTLSRIFEYYCLIKLQMAIVKCGYLFVEGNRVEYYSEDDPEAINNQYKFVGRGKKVTLLYEPSIWADKMNEGINLYSTGYNFSKSKWNNRWTPDFVIKIETDDKEYYYILDAKYSNLQNVKKRYIPELVLKYGTQIASKDKFFSEVIGVGALYPDTEDKMVLFKKNLVDSNKESLPKYFSLTVMDGDVGNNALKDRTESLFEIIELLEEEVRPTNFGNVVVEKEGTIDSSDELKEKKNTSVMDKVNGKRCFYNAKGMCLYKHMLCNIVDESCDCYVSKNSGKLLQEEDTCRNFIRYVRKGRVYRVECSISGLQGCVGSTECKFYLKKKRK